MSLLLVLGLSSLGTFKSFKLVLTLGHLTYCLKYLCFQSCYNFNKVIKIPTKAISQLDKHPTKQFFINRPFVDKNGLSNRYTSKNLLTSILTLADIAKIPPKITFSKDGY